MVQGGALAGADVAWAFTTFHVAQLAPAHVALAHARRGAVRARPPGAHHLVNARRCTPPNARAALPRARAAMTGALWRSAARRGAVRGPPAARRVGRVGRGAEGRAQHALRPARARRLGALAVERPRPARYALVAPCFAAEPPREADVVTLPFLLLLLDVWPLGRVAGVRRRRTPSAPRPSRRRGSSLEKLPLLALSRRVVGGDARRAAAAAVDARGTPPRRAHRERARLVRALPREDRLAREPRRVLPVPGSPRSRPGRCAGAAAAPRRRHGARRPRAARRLPVAARSGWLWFLGTLVPVIGLVQVGAQAMADRYTYLPVDRPVPRGRLGRAPRSSRGRRAAAGGGGGRRRRRVLSVAHAGAQVGALARPRDALPARRRASRGRTRSPTARSRSACGGPGGSRRRSTRPASRRGWIRATRGTGTTWRSSRAS